ncbi:flagellar biosynthesis protein FlhF [Gayadomonas joobiniege]|uniref:flagellar biosynthesis protein FlhF n=1 Tax=Gayadomonas joobiniege TaxID=1234606 RepID=UPI00037E94A7|nr:flagellar biosynthesis protein FlhF [Gayadomonas joobiniege]
MKIKRFVAKDIRAALNQVKAELGADAVIMSNNKTAEGVEIVAAVDETPQAAVQVQPQPAKPHSAQRAPVNTSEAESAPVADSLQAILQRQAEHSAKQAVANLTSTHKRQQIEAHSANAVKPKLDAQTAYTSNAKAATELTGLDDDFETNDVQDNELIPSDNERSELSSIKAEMAELRKLLHHQVSGLMWQEVARSQPQKAYVIERLREMGISEAVAEQVAGFIAADSSQSEAWQQALQLLSNKISVTRNDIMRQGGVVALVGPTGVGKTTTVAKLAAHFAKKYGPESVALVTTDTYRIGAYEQLQTYAKIIGCPCKVAHNSDELSQLLQQLKNRKLVLIDSAGMGQKDIRLGQQMDVLMQTVGVQIRSYLVLQATAQQKVMQEAVRYFSRTRLAGCIFTKLDECNSLGEIISTAIQNSLPIGYLTDGQRVPEDIKVASANYLVKKAAMFLDAEMSARTVQTHSAPQRSFAAAY